MLVRAIRLNDNVAVPEITIGRTYEVYTLSVYEGIVYLHIISDDDIITWLPANLFKIIDKAVPKDWIINIFSEPERDLLVAGPEFIASDYEAYSNMVEKHPEQVRSFREYVHSSSQEPK